MKGSEGERQEHGRLAARQHEDAPQADSPIADLTFGEVIANQDGEVEFEDNTWAAATFTSTEYAHPYVTPSHLEAATLKDARTASLDVESTLLPPTQHEREKRDLRIARFGPSGPPRQHQQQLPSRSIFSSEVLTSPPNPKVYSPLRGGIEDLQPFIHPSRLAQISDEYQHTTTATTNSANMSPTLAHPPRINPFQTNLPRDTPTRTPPIRRTSPSGSTTALFGATSAAHAEEELPPIVDAAAPDRSKIVVARQFLFQGECEAVGLGKERDFVGRLTGIGIIEGVRRALRMPIKTFGTACVFYLRYRYHIAASNEKDDKYDFRDAALACLWLASKAEETPKKSKEILCAARNLTLPVEDHLTPDDEVFEPQSKLMITLERKLLEIVAFDFRARNSADVLAGLAHETKLEKSTGVAALAICLDVHRTLAVLKQTRQTLAIACLELAARLLQKEEEIERLVSEDVYERVGSSRGEVAETIRDLIELYMSHQSLTVTGPRYTVEDFMRVSIALTSETKEKKLPRYSYYRTSALSSITSPTSPSISTPTVQQTPRTPAMNGGDATATGSAEKDKRDIDLGNPLSPPPPQFLHERNGSGSFGEGNASANTSPTSPTSPTQNPPPNPDDPSQISSIVRFVLDASRAHEEKVEIAPYYNIVTDEIVEERDVYIPIRKPSHSHQSNNANSNSNSNYSSSNQRTSRIHGGFLSRGPPNNSSDREDNSHSYHSTQRRTYTPPPHHRGAGRGGGGGEYRGRNARDLSPRRHSPPGRGGYRGGDRREGSPRRDGGGYRGSNDRRDGDRRRDGRDYR